VHLRPHVVGWEARMTARDDLEVTFAAHIPEVNHREAYCSCGAPIGDWASGFYTHLAEVVTAHGYTRPRIVSSVEELEALPVGAVVHSASGTIACRFDDYRGTVFGDDRAFGPWTRLALPATVLFEPTEKETR